MNMTQLTLGCAMHLGLTLGLPAAEPDLSKPISRTERVVEGWTIRMDDRLLQPPHLELGASILKSLEARLFNINAVVRPHVLSKLHAIRIVVDMSHGALRPMQYHPDAGWLKANGYAEDLARCVHIPVAAALIEPRQIHTQPWCVLHELAHAYHDQFLGFDEVRIRDAYAAYKACGRGEAALLVNGNRARHYGLTDHKEFFAEMTEAYFGTNDFFPFNRGELKTAEPEIHELMKTIWGPVQNGDMPDTSMKMKTLPGIPSGSGAKMLWYAQPAAQWMEALPLGNGRLGAMVFGGISNERISLNEQSIWTGGPYDPTRSGGPEALPEIRRLVFAGKHREAEALFNRTMLGNPVEQMKYQPLGDLWLDFPGHANVENYRRDLDLTKALASVSYQAEGVQFRREVFVSAPDQVVVVRVTCDSPGAICMSAGFSGVSNTKNPGDEAFATEVTPAGDLVLRGKTGSRLGIEGRLRYEGRVRIIQEGGKRAIGGGRVSIDGADSVTLLVAAATNFKRYDDISADPGAKVLDDLARASSKFPEDMRAAHVADHQGLFTRVELKLPESDISRLPTDQRLHDHLPTTDPQLAALMFQYGRYLLIASSRPGGQPGNLQGIWNEDMNPWWECKFTTNINTQMNYWPAETTALPECIEPLVRMVAELAETGGRIARSHYGADGWVFHQNTDQWRHAAPMDGAPWGTFSTGGAWLCMHLWEHYRFCGDENFLLEIYPLLKGAARFFIETLVEEPTRQWLVTCPSNSPENFPASPGNGPHHDDFINADMPGTTICAGATIEMGILRDLFGACMESSRILGVDEDFRRQLTEARRRLAPMRIGKNGQLQEWLEDWDDLEPKHRHISHLYGLFPSNQITPEQTPDLAKACKVSLGLRGDQGTGFGMAWKACCWARLHEGDRALDCLTRQIELQTTPNLFSKCFRAAQVDGAHGASAAIAEMLVQSHAGSIHLLPALPTSWSDGVVKGLRARDGFVIDIEWKGGVLTSALIHSLAGNVVCIRYGNECREIHPAKGENYLWRQA